MPNTPGTDWRFSDLNKAFKTVRADSGDIMVDQKGVTDLHAAEQRRATFYASSKRGSQSPFGNQGIADDFAWKRTNSMGSGYQT